NDFSGCRMNDRVDGCGHAVDSHSPDVVAALLGSACLDIAPQLPAIEQAVPGEVMVEAERQTPGCASSALCCAASQIRVAADTREAHRLQAVVIEDLLNVGREESIVPEDRQRVRRRELSAGVV